MIRFLNEGLSSSLIVLAGLCAFVSFLYRPPNDIDLSELRSSLVYSIAKNEEHFSWHSLKQHIFDVYNTTALL